jgi:hypothetical protein
LLPLTALLSQTLVAYTVEFDNEFEHRMPHRTTISAASAGGGPWLVSMVMWFNCLPILGYGLWSAGPSRPAFASIQGRHVDDVGHSLPTLLSRALLMAAVDFEARSKLPLAIYADVLRVLDSRAVPVRDLPGLSGVSKEAISMATAVLSKRIWWPSSQTPVGAVARWSALRQREPGRRARMSGSCELSSTTGSRGSAGGSSARCATRSSHSPVTPADRSCSRRCSHTPTGGALPCRSPRLCRAFRWCCIEADTPTAADWASSRRNICSVWDVRITGPT